jgi:hypothetical protein
VCPGRRRSHWLVSLQNSNIRGMGTVRN